MSVSQRAVRARLDADGNQVVEITIDAGYHPDTIVARAWMPLRLIFRRDEDDACSERVVFSAPRLDRRVAPFGTTTVELPAQPPGQVRFTCGMGRYRGRIDLVDGRVPTIAGRVRDWASHLETPAGTTLILWLGAPPLIALAAVLLLDGTAALLVAGAALVAWLAGCVWALSRSAHSA